MQITNGILTLLVSGIALTGCGNSHQASTAVDQIMASDSVPTPVKGVVKAVADDDSVEFARLVSYPLQRPYPLRDISTPEEMTSYYKTLVDDSLRKVISGSHPSEWTEEGWRGWTLDHGQYVWIDDNVYAVDYVSEAERKERDKLEENEIRSLHHKLRKGWKPRLCLVDTVSGRIYRVDRAEKQSKETEREYRLAVYADRKHLHDTPEASYTGRMDSEGSAETPVYVFMLPGGNRIMIEPAPADGRNPRMFKGPEDEGRELKRVYWRDLLEETPTDTIH